MTEQQNNRILDEEAEYYLCESVSFSGPIFSIVHEDFISPMIGKSKYIRKILIPKDKRHLSVQQLEDILIHKKGIDDKQQECSCKNNIVTCIDTLYIDDVIKNHIKDEIDFQDKDPTSFLNEGTVNIIDIFNALKKKNIKVVITITEIEK